MGGARDTLKEIGYDDPAKGLDYKTVNVIVAIEEQSPDIAQSVAADDTQPEDVGAGDQGIMFGYATDEHDTLMPLSAHLATALGTRLTHVRKAKLLDWVRPDGKTQVLVAHCSGTRSQRLPSRPLNMRTSSRPHSHLKILFFYNLAQPRVSHPNIR